MADENLIQRVPAGLLQVLNAVTSGANPRALSGNVQGVLDLLQFYGLTQRQTLSATNAALTEGTPLGIALPATWCVVFASTMDITKTATLSALRMSLSLQRPGGNSIGLMAQEGGPYGANETGAARFAFWAPYPILCPPSTVILGRADIIGTDANVAAVVTAEVGVLG